MLLAHEVDGDHAAPAIVLVHGITESRETWRPIRDALVVDHRVLTVDLRGHGASAHQPPYDPQHYAEDVAETIAAVELAEPILVGHSLGGVVVTVVPAFCDAVIGVVNVDQPLELGAFQGAVQQLEPQLRGTPEQFAEAMNAVFASMYGALDGDELVRIRSARRPDQDVVLGTWALLLDSTPEQLAATTPGLLAAVGGRPYLSLHGIDPGPGYADWLTANLPSATVEVWADHGHYPFLVDPKRFLDRLAEFERQVRG